MQVCFGISVYKIGGGRKICIFAWRIYLYCFSYLILFADYGTKQTQALGLRRPFSCICRCELLGHG